MMCDDLPLTATGMHMCLSLNLFSVLISNMININGYNPHEQILFRSLTTSMSLTVGDSVLLSRLPFPQLFSILLAAHQPPGCCLNVTM